MAVFEGLGKRISQTGQGALTKTKNAAESMKLNNQIADAERAISAYCDIIGREYYAKYAAGGWDPDFDEMFVGIEDEKEKITDCKYQLRAMRGVIECPGCGRELASDMNFCGHCGAKLAIAEPVKTEISADSNESADEDEQEKAPEDEEKLSDSEHQTERI